VGMNELEMEIGRQLGAASFFIYQTIKHNPKSSLKDLEVGTGLNEKSVKLHLKNLLECGIITREQVFLRYCKGFIYTSNEAKETWKLH
jgi:predicted transcriptional regulator